jgi:hypothetical protein
MSFGFLFVAIKAVTSKGKKRQTIVLGVKKKKSYWQC